MGVTRTRYLSEFEIHVLLAVAQLGADAYGVSILREIERRSGRRVWIGPLYTSLAKLERLRLLRGRASEPLAIRGGRSRRLYSLTAADHPRYTIRLPCWIECATAFVFARSGAFRSDHARDDDSTTHCTRAIARPRPG
jgi:hypothetical protein